MSPSARAQRETEWMSHGDAVDEAGRARTLVSVLEVEGSRQRNAIETRHELVQLDVGRGGSDRHATDIIGKLDLERESHRDGVRVLWWGSGWLVGLEGGLVVVWERERKSGCLRRGVAFVPLVVHRGKFLSLNPPKIAGHRSLLFSAAVLRWRSLG